MSAFVYGTLMYPDVLQALIRRVPRMEPAVIRGFQRHPIRHQVGWRRGWWRRGAGRGAGRAGLPGVSSHAPLSCNTNAMHHLQVFPGAVPASADSSVAGFVLLDLAPAEVEVRGPSDSAAVLCPACWRTTHGSA